MINYGKVRSSEIPQETEITSEYVFVASNIEPYEFSIEDKVLSGYEYGPDGSKGASADLHERISQQYEQLQLSEDALR